jgi:hypothetical protein
MVPTVLSVSLVVLLFLGYGLGSDMSSGQEDDAKEKVLLK